MSKPYFRTAFNSLLKRKNHSIISLIGLIIAFTAVFYIVSIVRFETSFDSHHKNINQIYRISGDIIASENTMAHAVLGPLMGPALKREYPSIKAFTRLIPVKHSVNLEAERQIFQVDEAYTADASVFNIFTFEFIYGNPTQALQRPDEIVINESLSQKMYGPVNPVGKTIIRDGTPLRVAGVVKDSPGNAHHQLNVLFSMGDWWNNKEGISDVRESEAYWMPSCYLFVLLQKGAEIGSVTNNFEAFYDKYMATFGHHLNARFKPIAIPLKDLHFSRNMSYDYPKGSRTYAHMFVAIGIFIIIIALINYSNLLLAQNIVQAKNIGIRKINGASQLHIYGLLFLNSIVVIAVSLLSALLLYHLSMPLFVKLPLLQMKAIDWWPMVYMCLGLMIAISALSALIPFIHQAKKSGLLLILKRVPSANRSPLGFGQVSTIAQLSLSIILLIAVMLMGKQLRYLIESDMGFDKDNVIMVKLNKTICQSEIVKSLKQELLRNTSVESVAFSRYAPGEVLSSLHFQMDRDGKTVTKIVNGMEVDYDYIPLMKMEFAEGRNFNANFNDEDNAVIVNEAAIRFCGLTAPVVGQEIANVKIIGVLKDVCFNSLYNQTEPLLLYIDEQQDGYLNIRMRPNSNVTLLLERIEESWQLFFDNEPLELQFLDSRVSLMYKDDYARGQLIKLFTLLSLVIALMGLFNISLLKSNQRTKEIGIRKVNGARVMEILTLLNKEFIMWVVIAFIIACPIAWYTVDRWLENFAYKTSLSWWIYALAGLLTLVIALLTVSWQGWRAARRNPVEALRYE